MAPPKPGLLWLFILVGVSIAGAVLWASVRRTASPAGPSQRRSPESLARSAWFTNMAEPAGIRFRHISGQGEELYMPEIMTGGVCLLDYDRDGWLDVYFVQAGRITEDSGSGPRNELYRNRGDGTFENVSKRSGAADPGYGMGCTCGDFNKDGWQDIYVTNVGPNVLYENNGDGSFTNVTARAGVADPGFSASAAFFDYDRDGDLDLFVANYIRWSLEAELPCRGPSGQRDYCMPTNYGAPAPDTLYRNDADGTFTDVSEGSGVALSYGYGLGVLATDFDGNGFADVYVANDRTANGLWMNQGDGTFRDEALERGGAYSGEGAVEAGMGVDAQDVDGDLDFDLFMTHFAGETHTLYLYHDGFWNDETAAYGLSPTRPFTGFGTSLTDLDNDGLLDAYVANGRVVRGRFGYARVDPYVEPNQLFAGVRGGGFQEVQPTGGTVESLIHASRGAAFGDYDNDGDIDVFVVNRDAAPYVLRNEVGQDSNWLMFELTNAYGTPAIGARVRLEVDGTVYLREVRVAYSYCSSSDPRVHFGLGQATGAHHVTVTWPEGRVDEVGPVEGNRVIRLSAVP